jgi:hypothetical protein
VAVYFQKISDNQFNQEESFLVKESKRMRLFIGLISLAIACVMVKSSIILAAVAAAFGIGSLLASRKNQVVMEINKDGFFYYGRLITGWNHFVSASFIDQAPQLSTNSLGISDQFFIAVRYRKENSQDCFERKIPLTNMQDKSEEEIMAAIRFYYTKSKGSE